MKFESRSDYAFLVGQHNRVHSSITVRKKVFFSEKQHWKWVFVRKIGSQPGGRRYRYFDSELAVLIGQKTHCQNLHLLNGQSKQDAEFHSFVICWKNLYLPETILSSVMAKNCQSQSVKFKYSLQPIFGALHSFDSLVMAEQFFFIFQSTILTNEFCMNKLAIRNKLWKSKSDFDWNEFHLLLKCLLRCI